YSWPATAFAARVDSGCPQPEPMSSETESPLHGPFALRALQPPHAPGTGWPRLAGGMPAPHGLAHEVPEKDTGPANPLLGGRRRESVSCGARRMAHESLPHGSRGGAPLLSGHGTVIRAAAGPRGPGGRSAPLARRQRARAAADVGAARPGRH